MKLLQYVSLMIKWFLNSIVIQRLQYIKLILYANESQNLLQNKNNIDNKPSILWRKYNIEFNFFKLYKKWSNTHLNPLDPSQGHSTEFFIIAFLWQNILDRVRATFTLRISSNSPFLLRFEYYLCKFFYFGFIFQRYCRYEYLLLCR